MGSRSRLSAVALIALSALSGCGQGVRRFALADPLWEDPDRNHVPWTPGKYFSGLLADGADKGIFRPLARVFWFPLPGEAWNVNALDELPNSSWFVNRIGLHDLSPDEAALGACAGEPEPAPAPGSWLVTAAKPDGANPGFFIKAASGTYLLKVDGPVQPQRATAADVIGSRLYWAAGYHAPCNQIVYFERSALRIDPSAETETATGEKRPISEADVDAVLSKAFRLKDGSMRCSLSRFLPGKPLGPFRYEGTRPDDPNDVIPHQERRELRGSRILAAWINHHDAREQNSLDVWMNQTRPHHIRHYMIDFGDCFGGRWDYDPVSRRIGHSYLLDWKDLALDLLTLGLLPRPWYRAKINEEAEIFGYFGPEDFVASRWKPDYPNPAFERMTFRDALWMVRIISRFSDAHVRAIVAQGRLTDPRAERYLVKTLIARRDQLLREYLTRYAPLDRFRLVRRTPGKSTQSLCFEDLALQRGLVNPRHVLYKLRFQGGQRLERELGWLQFPPDPDHPARSCVVMPIGDKRPADLVPAQAPGSHPGRYGVLQIYIHQKPAVPPTSGLALHFYDLGRERGYRLVGIERQPIPVTPDLY